MTDFLSLFFWFLLCGFHSFSLEAERSLHSTHGPFLRIQTFFFFLTKVCILFALKSWMFFSNLHVYYTSSACLFSGDSNIHVCLWCSRKSPFYTTLNDFLVSIYGCPEIRLLRFCIAAWSQPCNVELKWWNSPWKKPVATGYMPVSVSLTHFIPKILICNSHTI